MPRHPPCALKNLNTRSTYIHRSHSRAKMLTSTVQFSSNGQPDGAGDRTPRPGRTTTPPHRPPGTSTPPHHAPGAAPQHDSTGTAASSRPVPQDPTARRPASVPPEAPPRGHKPRAWPPTHPHPPPRAPRTAWHPQHRAGRGLLPRKEVIQPHLPVRLPCYDFVPIADPTFDSSPPRTGWATGFGCYRLS